MNTYKLNRHKSGNYTLYQIRLNSHRMVKLGVLRSQETGVRRRKNYKDEGSYDD
ncbi:MAG: hypothetical protein F6K18_18410 [Okeania sp. SIO2C2]|uniref:hypothetical protein n=1 Tax=Okeania sp. SIO2C2 TaxID=2607787 RepID=UPI0013B633A0|nr:hypothetical protein [Okeania sp. SIO2C2]NEP88648.1 hypothetical protein [Okeania sp. SIO2C2]